MRTQLREQRDFRIRQLEQLEETIAGTPAFSAEQPQDEVILDLQAAAMFALTEVEAALMRMDEDRYGVCERCGTPIAAARLEVLPMVRLCMPCQATHERQMRRESERAQPT